LWKDDVWKKDLTEFSRQFEHPAWGFHHAMRVYAMALQLARAEHVIIEGHMFYHEPDTHSESLFFHDADALDFMGVIGVTRMLSIVGLDDWAPDLDSGVRLIEKFSTELPEAIGSSQARQITSDRRREMEAFIHTLSVQTFDWKHL
jgi:hypothetical protein